MTMTMTTTDDYRVKDYLEKAKAARKDAPDIAALRKLPRSPSGTLFLVDKTLFAWMSFDRKPDDGITSIRPEGSHEKAPGRYRRLVPA